MNNTIENLLFEWGSTKRQLPINNLAMKEEVLSKFKSSGMTAPRHVSSGLPWASFAFTAFAVLALVVLSVKNPGSKNITQPLGTIGISQNHRESLDGQKSTPEPVVPLQDTTASKSISNSNSYGGSSAITEQTPLNFGASEIPTTDNREYLKTDYSASVQTNKVQELTGRLQTTIRGFDGRIDSTYNYSNQGYISFVIPASRVDAFRQEVKTIAGARFYTENLSSQNMLSDKRSLEDQQKQNNDNIKQLTASRDQLTVSHNQSVTSLNSQISTIAKEMAGLKTEAATNINYDRQVQIAARQEELQKQTKVLNSRLAAENNNYASQISSLDYQTSDAQRNLAQLDKQTGELIDTVATVRGNISISYISFWQKVDAYLPTYWLVYLLFIGALVSYYVYRRRIIVSSI